MGWSVSDSEGLTHNDLAGPLLRAQMGLDKAEEYKETLTAPLLGSEFSLPEVRSVLTELREIQKDVLALLETFWDKLEAQEGHVQFKDEFARWYTESLELLASVEPTHRQPRAASVSSEPPLQGQGEPTESSEGATPSELLNRAINWFKDLPSVPKLIIVGLVLLLLFTVLSPVAQVAAIIVFVLSAIVLIALAVQRRPLRGWIIAVVGSLVLIPIFGGISSVTYGGLLGDDGLGTKSMTTLQVEVGAEARNYIRQRADIQFQLTRLNDRQTELYNFCLEVCAYESVSEQLTNARSGNELLGSLASLTPPSGYEESHRAFEAGMETYNSRLYQISIQAIDGTEADSLQSEALDKIFLSLDLMPPGGREYHRDYAEQNAVPPDGESGDV